MLLGEFETHHSEGGDTPQKSSFELLKQCAGVLEKNVERLAQRAEVSFAYILLLAQATNLTCPCSIFSSKTSLSNRSERV